MIEQRRRRMAWASIGTVLAIGAALATVVAMQQRRFREGVRADARALWAHPRGTARTPVSLDAVPPPVRRYLEVSGAAHHAPVAAVRLRHGGSFRPSLDGRWFPIRGEQYFSSDPPGFVWWGSIRLAPGLRIEARDRSLAGDGSMLVKAASIFTLADARGPEIDQGALLRLLGEMAWFPTVLLDGRHISWAAIDATSARATLRVGGREVSGTLRFGPDGLVTMLEAERYRDVGGKAVLTPFLGSLSDYRDVDGLRVPFRLSASWVIEGRPQPYARWETEQIELDRPEPY